MHRGRTAFRECFELEKRVHGPEHFATLAVQDSLGNALVGLGRLAEAEALLRQCHDALFRILGPDHPRFLHTVAALSKVLEAQGRRERPTLLRSCLEAQRRTLGPDHADTQTEKQLAALAAARAAKK